MLRREIVVKQVSISEFEEIFELRVFLERHCARLAAHRATEWQLQKMERVLAGIARLQDGDLEGMIAIDRRFHRLLYAAADNEFLADILERLYDLSLRRGHLVRSHLEDGRLWIEQHHKVLDALKEGDEAEAGALIEQHIVELRRSTRAVV
jgi:DNA-binding GntR family transcriptional regulator